MTTEKKTRIPRDPEAIKEGLLSLELKDRIEIKKAIDTSITDEIATKKAEYEQAPRMYDSL